MEQIATQLGVVVNTIHHDLKGFSTIEKPPRPKGGRPKGSTKPRKGKKNHTDAAQQAAQLVLDGGLTHGEAGKKAGIGGESLVRVAVAREEGRRETAEELLDAAAAKKFSESGALRIEDAIRIHKERLNKAFEHAVNEEVRKRIAAADDSARIHNKELVKENIQLRQMLNQRGVLSEAQFNNLLKCIHPDNSASVAVRNELLPFLIKNKQRLVTTLH
jgi:hypothetical protein